MDVPSSYTAHFIKDYYKKSLLILSSCSEQCLKDYLTAGSLFFSPLIHFMPFLFAQQFTTLVMVHCISHRNDSAFSDKHLTCYMEQIQEKVGLTGYWGKDRDSFAFLHIRKVNREF